NGFCRGAESGNAKGFECRPLEGRRRVFGGRRPKASKGGNRDGRTVALHGSGRHRILALPLLLLWVIEAPLPGCHLGRGVFLARDRLAAQSDGITVGVRRTVFWSGT